MVLGSKNTDLDLDNLRVSHAVHIRLLQGHYGDGFGVEGFWCRRLGLGFRVPVAGVCKNAESHGQGNVGNWTLNP